MAHLLFFCRTSDITDMASTGTRTHSGGLSPVLMLWASLCAWGQPAGENAVTPHLAIPEWLAPFPQARDQAEKAAAAEGAANYTAVAHSAAVVSYYEQQLRDAGLTFKTRNDGIGVSIEVSAEKISAVVRIREDGDVSKVKVSYALAQEKSVVQPVQNPQAPIPAVRQPAPLSSSKREPTSPYTRAPYIWIMQSAIVRGSNPRKYSAIYFEAPTDRSVETPLTLPAGATIVDVFPDNCTFSLQNQDSHVLTFNQKEEALGKRLAPGTWLVYPMKCGGIDIFLH
jgi:hypothetical protein